MNMRLSLLFVTFVLGGCASTTLSTRDSTTQLPEATDQMAHGGRDGDPVGQSASSDRRDSSVVFVAHRGGIVDGIPENTLAAFRHAIEAGADAIEIDLRGTKDGEIVIMHDETVDRTTDGRGLVSDLTFSELKMLDAGGGERIPSYEDVLQLTSGTGAILLLDIKESPALDKRQVVRLTEAHDAELHVIVGARRLEDLRTFRSLNPNLRTLGFIRGIEDVEPFVDAGVDIIRLWPDWIHDDPDLVGRVHDLGKPVWTTAGTSSRHELDELIEMGVNGILTDLPELMNEMQSQR
jgi:glycerophosphoryl diester phosphodiesterase